jgi:SAM-dependent methyltransferase
VIAADSTVWQEVEYGSYSADLPLWEELSAATEPPNLELGCGIGRVALHLGRRGHEVWGIDLDRGRLEELERRAREAGLPVHPVEADASRFTLGRSFGLIIAPMQLAELLGARGARSMLDAAARHLSPGGSIAIALCDHDALPSPGDRDSPSPLPDVRERDGWVFSSLPLGLEYDEGSLRADRLRQVVSPSGDLTEARESVSLELLGPKRVEAMAAEAGLRPGGRRTVSPTEAHAGSVVVVVEMPDG